MTVTVLCSFCGQRFTHDGYEAGVRTDCDDCRLLANLKAARSICADPGYWNHVPDDEFETTLLFGALTRANVLGRNMMDEIAAVNGAMPEGIQDVFAFDRSAATLDEALAVLDRAILSVVPANAPPSLFDALASWHDQPREAVTKVTHQRKQVHEQVIS